MKSANKWYVMAAVGGGVFLATIDGGIVNIALPILERDLNTHFAVVQWVVLAYLLTVATLMLSIGRLADMIGKKWLYLTGFVIFTTGSVLCGLSSTIGMLIGFRVLQAVGSAMMMALGTAIVTEAFPPEERGKALGLTGLLVSLGAISGPTLGGLILGSLSWHWIFFVNLPVGMLGIWMVIQFVPATRPPGGQTFDFPGAGALFIMLLAFLMGLTIGQNEGFTSMPVLALFCVSLVFLALFIRIENRARDPLIDFTLFKNSLFSINLITGFLTFVSSAGTVLLMPFFLENILQYSPQKAGLLLVTVPIAMGIVAPFSGALSDRFGTRSLTFLGLVILLGGYIAVNTLNENMPMLGYILRFVPIGIGMGCFQSPNNSAIMGAAPRHRLGVASGLLSLTRTIGQTTGIALLGALWASRVNALGGSLVDGDITTAPLEVQMSALHQTLVVLVGFITVALLLSLYALLKERRERRSQ